MPYRGYYLQPIFSVILVVDLQCRHQRIRERTPSGPGQVAGIFILLDDISKGECLSIYNHFWAENLSLVRHILSDYDFATVSSEVSGHYAMIFIDRTIDDRLFVDAMKMLMKDKGYFAYPGVMQCLDLKHRFCFRVNLLLNKADLECGLKTVLDYFKDTLGSIR